MKYIPIVEKQHAVGNGIHKIFRFPNGFGASVVRFKTFGTYGSYTNNENEWELAVIKFNNMPPYNEDFELVYNTDITDDVMGHLTEKEVEEILDKISLLKGD